VPDYIRDNLALFRIGSTWVGSLEGATFAMGLSHSWTAGWLGGVGGLTAGAFAGWWLDDRSPNYGRVALIQSSALMGVMAGAVAVSAIGRYPTAPEAVRKPGVDAPSDSPEVVAYNKYKVDYNYYRNQIKQRMGWGMLAGLNVGLAAGIAMAYLPDQHVYGPSWQRVLMVDLAGLAGAVFATTIEMCSRHNIHCADDNNSMNSRTARFALAGAGLGLIGGWLLTMNFDHNREGQSERPLLSAIPMPGVVPLESPTGAPELLPGLLAHGRF
jgi:hypothetical protein